MHSLRRLATVAAVALTLPNVGAAQTVDVFLVYSSAGRAMKTRIADVLGAHYTVRAYNTDQLAIGDYSGTQRVVARLETARMVVVVDQGAKEDLDAARLSRDVVLVNTETMVFNTSGHLVHVGDGSVAPPAGADSPIAMVSPTDVLNPDELRQIGAVAVRGGLSVVEAVGTVIGTLLR